MAIILNSVGYIFGFDKYRVMVCNAIMYNMYILCYYSKLNFIYLFLYFLIEIIVLQFVSIYISTIQYLEYLMMMMIIIIIPI